MAKRPATTPLLSTNLYESMGDIKGSFFSLEKANDPLAGGDT